ncbi:MAG: hypothetical protein WC635_04230 [Bacteriovorax sp.]|jgi:hypothetical protein
MKISFSLLMLASLGLASCSSMMKHPERANYTKEPEYRTIASDKKATIEQWKGDNALKFVYRDARGLFKSWAVLEFESWQGSEKSKWVARLENGQFVTGYTGETEKFNVGKGKEELRLVIRNATGEFVTWKALDDLIDAGFDSWDVDGNGQAETVYVVRYDGKFLNWARASLEDWSNFEAPVLVVRDTSDGSDNGKLLAWIAPDFYKSGPNKGNAYYKDPETGRFISPNKN